MSDNLGTAGLNLVADLAEKNCPRENEYLDEETGLLRCQICGGPRQVTVQPWPDQPPRVVRCMCKCPTEEDLRKERERKDQIERRRRACFKDTDMADWSFANDDRKRPELSDAAARYAEQFDTHLRNGQGLLYYGPVGTGKTYLAACIANAVIDRGYSARMTNFTDIANALWDAEYKDVYMAELRGYDLLILDDLGAERKNEYMQEIVYNVIDARNRAGRPVIITTNLTTDELSKTDEMGYSRIYDRLLQRCLPIGVAGHSRRREAAGQSWGAMRKQLGMEA